MLRSTFLAVFGYLERIVVSSFGHFVKNLSGTGYFLFMFCRLSLGNECKKASSTILIVVLESLATSLSASESGSGSQNTCSLYSSSSSTSPLAQMVCHCRGCCWSSAPRAGQPRWLWHNLGWMESAHFWNWCSQHSVFLRTLHRFILCFLGALCCFNRGGVLLFYNSHPLSNFLYFMLHRFVIFSHLVTNQFKQRWYLGIVWVVPMALTMVLLVAMQTGKLLEDILILFQDWTRKKANLYVYMVVEMVMSLCTFWHFVCLIL